MVPTIQDAPTQANNVQPSQDNAEDQYRLASWPAQELLDSTKTTQDVLKVWKEFPHPPELMKLPHYVPSELREIVRLSLVVEQDPQPTKQTPTIIETASGDSMLMSGGLSRPQTSSSRASSRERSTSGSSPRTSIESSTRTSKGSHNHSIAKGLEPALKMGPLGWIGSAPEKEKPLKSSLLSIARKTKRPKDAAPKLATPKAETNLMKFLKEQKQPGECASCFEEMPNNKLAQLECRHKYCSTCFEQLISTAMHTESQFPPKCCLQEIPMSIILSVLSNEKREEYKLKVQEYALPAGSRWYCPSASCGKWIPLQRLRRGAREQKCPYCRLSICTTCRGTAHDRNEDCPQDFGLDATLEEAEREGWRRCYRCRAMVELTVGCRHITCKCKAEFCYTCGAAWKTCACTELDQARRQQEIADRRAERQAAEHAQDEAARREEEEITAAIAAVEAQERREAEERERLEREMREEEERRRREEEESAQRREEQRRSNIEWRLHFLLKTLYGLHVSQQALLISRHGTQANSISAATAAAEAAFKERRDKLCSTLEANLAARITQLSTAHEEAITAMTFRHEEEEDDTFLNVQLHLRNKPNKEARERSMLEKLKAAQLQELEDLRDEQVRKLAELRQHGRMEKKGLESGLNIKRWEEIKQAEEDREALAKRVCVERKWFDVVVAKRLEMLERWKEDMLTSGREVEVNEDVVELESPTVPARNPERVITRKPLVVASVIKEEAMFTFIGFGEDSISGLRPRASVRV